MKVLADTSVLVAALVVTHPDHAHAFPWLRDATTTKKIDLSVAAHSLAELYAVLTTLPIYPRIRPDMARRLIRESVESVAVTIELSAGDYRHVLDELADGGWPGGVVYDALIARAAQKAQVDRLVTFNVSDFQRVWPQGADRIIAP